MKCQWCANPESQLYTPEVIFIPISALACGKCKEACDILKNSQSVKVGNLRGAKIAEIVYLYAAPGHEVSSENR